MCRWDMYGPDRAVVLPTRRAHVVAAAPRELVGEPSDGPDARRSSSRALLRAGSPTTISHRPHADAARRQRARPLAPRRARRTPRSTCHRPRCDAPRTATRSIDIVNDDMPFLVDSVTMALDRHDLGVHLVVHPILRVRARPATASCVASRTDATEPATTTCVWSRGCTSKSTGRRVGRHPRQRCAPTSSACSPTCAPRRATG